MSEQSNSAQAPAFNLASLLGKTPQTATVEFKEGFRFNLRYVSKAQIQVIAQNCSVYVYNPKVNGREKQLDPAKFTKEFCESAVLGWSGITLSKLARMVPVDVSALDKAQLEAELPFTQEHLALLLTNMYELDTFIQNAATDMAYFNGPNFADELKN